MARISPDETSLRSPVETRQQADAYIRYYAMGENRSFRALARETGVTIGTLSNWGKKFKWKEKTSFGRHIYMALKERSITK